MSGSNDYEVFFEGCCRLAGTEFACFFWYQSTNTDAEGVEGCCRLSGTASPGFTGKQVKILTLKALGINNNGNLPVYVSTQVQMRQSVQLVSGDLGVRVCVCARVCMSIRMSVCMYRAAPA